MNNSMTHYRWYKPALFIPSAKPLLTTEIQLPDEITLTAALHDAGVRNYHLLKQFASDFADKALSPLHISFQTEVALVSYINNLPSDADDLISMMGLRKDLIVKALLRGHPAAILELAMHGFIPG
jgi:hypothetical protein